MINQPKLGASEYFDRKYSGAVVIWVKKPKISAKGRRPGKGAFQKLLSKAKKHPKYRKDLVIDNRSARYLVLREPPQTY